MMIYYTKTQSTIMIFKKRIKIKKLNSVLKISNKLNKPIYLDIKKILNKDNIKKEIKDAHLIEGAVLLPGAKAPNLVTKEMLKDLNEGTVLVDVAVDQGGCFETTKPTTHSSPTYIVDDILHYSVANMPGAVPMTSTEALTNATIGYAIEIANKGWKSACIDNAPLMKGLNIINGKIVYKAVADAFNLPYSEIDL